MSRLDEIEEDDEANLEVNPDRPSADGIEHATIVPVIAEQLTVDKRIVETGRIRVQTTVHEHEEVVDEPLKRNDVTVEVVPIQKYVVGSPPVARQEGEIFIVPVLEERLCVERRLFLKEEVHIRSSQTTFHDRQSVVLRQTEVSVERVESSES